MLFFPLIIAIFIFFPFSSSLPEYDYRYSNCTPSQFKCGNIPQMIKYPFNANTRRDYCGYPEFDLQCVGNQKATITIETQDYRVLDIITDNRTMKIVKNGLSEDSICTSGGGGGVLVNTTFNYTIFNYASGYINLTLFFGCASNSSVMVNGNPKPVKVGDVTCSVNNGEGSSGLVPFTVGFDEVQAEELSMKGGCNRIVIVPVHETNVEEILYNSSALGTILVGGFVLQWFAIVDGDCAMCMESGGTCGYNTTLGKPTCFCTDQAYDTMCPQPQGTYYYVHLFVSFASYSSSYIHTISAILIPRHGFKNRELIDSDQNQL
ncbi:LEAF RUST 10 DISEASE-RESISTANCE LOCUS RECEPTOR-LIKE PROTEIN KINASE-like 2.7 [Telopea speciosissima]|uniref:LEAF RUST 10 DISEASE-RESISTANCE LOCUS RECEPTOR-LIKE PROTEIN KINASE-like 2.7 n=1 Tax=Telopea speciosissima TaxID=54955 RepID=UPI001CC5741D|nr:LEAF RUST 10 DISEASE-RESISTANCE LOCUS RECEPTOR-LIKE PROTEIN KINASE-like 2.7 [Telopea speciosissima]